MEAEWELRVFCPLCDQRGRGDTRADKTRLTFTPPPPPPPNTPGPVQPAAGTQCEDGPPHVKSKSSYFPPGFSFWSLCGRRCRCRSRTTRTSRRSKISVWAPRDGSAATAKEEWRCGAGRRRAGASRSSRWGRNSSQPLSANQLQMCWFLQPFKLLMK